jgi:hypothetical protein
MILDVVKLAIGAGTHIMTNRQKRKMLESDAAMLHAQKMANGEVEYQQTVRQSNDKGWKDEFVLILISLPILLLIWSVFSDDPTIQEKMIWIISAMLVYHDVPQPVLTDYTIRSFDTKYECIEYTWDNKVKMVDTLLEMHRYKENKELKTFAFFCENRYVQLDDV